MISRIIDATVMLGGGLIVGWLLVSPAEHPPAMPAQVEAPAMSAPVASKPAPDVDLPVVDQAEPLPDCPEPAAKPPAKVPHSNPPLPPVYAEMLGAVANTATSSQQ